MAEKITIEDLVGMVKRGFDGVDERFDSIDARFDENTKQHQQIFKRLEKLERGQEDIHSLLGKVAFGFEVRALDRRLKLVEEKLAMA